MYFKSASAVFSAMRMLFNKWSTLPLLIAVYAALLLALYLFISTREATVSQVVVTFVVMVAAPLLFFLLQAASVNYATSPSNLIKKTLGDALKFIAVSLPVIGLTILAVYLVGKLQGRLPINPDTKEVSRNALTFLIVVRYLIIGVIAPLVMIQLWIATSTHGLRPLLRNFREAIRRAFAPQAVLIFAAGFLVFAVAPYYLLFETISIQRAWLDVSLLTARVAISALLVLLGWVTTVGALSILSTRNTETAVVHE